MRPDCPSCREVIEFLHRQGIHYHERNVVSDFKAVMELQRLGEPDKTPILDWYGTILVGFGVEELKPFLLERKVLQENC